MAGAASTPRWPGSAACRIFAGSCCLLTTSPRLARLERGGGGVGEGSGDRQAYVRCLRPQGLGHRPPLLRRGRRLARAGPEPDRGWDRILGDLLAKGVSLSGGTLRAELADVLVGKERVAAFVHVIGERADKRLDLTFCQVMTFRDGRIADVAGHPSDLYQLDEFWA